MNPQLIRIRVTDEKDPMAAEMGDRNGGAYKDRNGLVAASLMTT